MNTRFTRGLIALFTMLIASAPALVASRSWADPSESWETLGPPRGTLMAIGGAAVLRNYETFMELVGDPHALIVVIPTASASDYTAEGSAAYRRITGLGATNVVMLHTTDRSEADSEAFVEPLTRARAVFISGGRQSRLSASYLYTRTHRELFNLLDRGGLIAGTSAGASIQGTYLVGGNRDHRVGFNLLRESAIGQHYVRRNRVGSVGRIIRRNPELLGFGIAEATAMVIRGNEFEVVGDSRVAVYDNQRPGWPEDVDEEQIWLFPGDRYDIKARQVIHRRVAPPTDIWEGARQPWADPALAWNAHTPPQGRLLIAGSDADEVIRQKFLELSGDLTAPHVVLSTGNVDDRQRSEDLAEELRRLGARNVAVLHTIDRNWANSETFTVPLREARGVWIADCVRWKLADVYLHTLAHRELFEVLRRGGVVAGEGRGAQNLSSTLFREGDRWDAGWHTGYGLLNVAVVHPQPLESDAAKSLREILKGDRRLLAMGVPEATGVVVESGRLTVIGRGDVVIQAGSWPALQRARTLAPGESMDLGVRD